MCVYIYGLLRFQNAEFSSFWWVFDFFIHRKNILIHENAVLDWNLQRLDWEHYAYLKLDYFSGPYTHCDWLKFQMFMLLKVSLIAVIWNTHKQREQYLACFFWHRRHISIRPRCHLAIFSTFLVSIHEALVERTDNAAHAFLVIFLLSKAAHAFHGIFRSSYDCKWHINTCYSFQKMFLNHSRDISFHNSALF